MMIKRSVVVFLLLSLLLPSCVRRKHATTGKNNVHKYEDGGRTGTYDEDLGAFVLEDDTDYDLFEEASEEGGTKKDDIDDSWAWEELDDDQPTETIYFDFNEGNLKKDQEPILRYNADLCKLACEDGAEIIVEGHSCLITRSQMYNQALSQRRANTVKKELIKFGVPKKCLKAVGHGTAYVTTKAEGKDSQAPNRRVELKFKYPK